MKSTSFPAPAAFTPRPTSRWVLGQLVTPVQTGSDFGMLTIVTPAGADGPPPHHHDDAVELFLVLEGCLEVMIDGAWLTLGPGDNAIVPVGSIHTFRNRSEQDACWLTTFAPKGFERFFEDFGQPVDRPGSREASLAPELIQRVITRSADYGMILAH
jgi:quercetin dioxygenase-like cupin family protein